jgi:hypothetical protein
MTVEHAIPGMRYGCIVGRNTVVRWWRIVIWHTILWCRSIVNLLLVRLVLDEVHFGFAGLFGVLDVDFWWGNVFWFLGQNVDQGLLFVGGANLEVLLCPLGIGWCFDEDDLVVLLGRSRRDHVRRRLFFVLWWCHMHVDVLVNLGLYPVHRFGALMRCHIQSVGVLLWSRVWYEGRT